MKFNPIILLAFLLLVSGCSITKEQVIEMARNQFETGIEIDTMEVNQTTELFNYYLPSELELEEVTDNNIILSKDKQLFLIFSNPAEDQLSKVNYEQDRIVETNAILTETIEVDGIFNYIIISPFKDEKYKVVVGSGGEKGTTITEMENIKDSVETILQIIRSIRYE